MKTFKTKPGSKFLLLISLALTVSIAMLPMVIFSGCDDDDGSSGRRSEQEPNNAFAECNLVGLSTIRIQGAIDSPGDIDFFCFDIEEPDTILDIEIDTEGGPLVPFLELFGPNQNLLADGDTFIEFTAGQAGRYYVSVTNTQPQGGSDFSYVSTLTSVPPEPPSPTATPTGSPTPTPSATPTPTPTGTPPPSPQMHDVSMVDNEFVQSDITINVGDTVRWTNDGQVNHDVRSDDGTTFNSADEFPLPTGIPPGEAFEFTFNQAGDFPYFCIFHGAAGGIGMSGTVTVE